MANIIIQKDGQTIAVNPRKLNFVANGNVIFDIVESPPKTAIVGITAAGGAGTDLFLLSPKGGETYLFNPTFTSNLTLLSPATGSIVKQYHPVTVIWSKTNLTFVDVAYSMDNGVTWVQVASSSIDVAVTFNMPAVAVDTQTLIKINGNSILHSTAITDQFTALTLINPSGSSQQYASGAVIPILWSETNVPVADLDYSFDNISWLPIATNIAGTTYNWAYPGGNSARITYIKVKESPVAYISNTNSFTEAAAIPLSGLVLWLDPSDSSTITKDISDNITGWLDKSPNGTVLTFPGGKNPVWVDNQLSGKPVAYFDGTKNVKTNLSLDNTSCSIFLIAKTTATVGDAKAGIFVGDLGVNFEFYGLYIGFESNGPPADFVSYKGNGSNSFDANLHQSNAINYGTFYAGSVIWNGTNGSMAINNGTPVLASSTNAYATNLMELSSTVYRPFLGQLAGLIVYNRPVNSTETTQIYNYIQAHWPGIF